jgi:hypothetical protein
MRIKFIKSPTGIGYGYHEGEEANFPNNQARVFIEDGYAEEVRPKDEMPMDIPGRAVLIDNGFRSLQEVREVASVELLTAYQGIGRATAQRIVRYIQEK